MQDVIIANHNKRSKLSNFGLRLVEREKKKIASELHDDVASKLSIIRLKLCSNPENLGDIIELLDNTICSVRKISYGLHLQSLKNISFLDAIRDFVFPLNDLIKVEINCSYIPSFQMNHRTKLNLFRIFQEVIHNILKHANASQILITLDFSNNFLSLSIGDNGRGFLNKSLTKFGIGLENIKYRCKEIKAEYNFVTSKNKGTTFLISLPITNSTL